MEAISVIIPVYNEAEGLPGILRQTEALLSAAACRFHFILVDDGSTDGSGEILAGLAGRAAYTVLRHHENYGYGAALKSGLRQADTSRVGIVDADGTYPLDRLPELAAGLQEGGYAMVVGDRSARPCSVPFRRRAAKWVLTRLANYITGRRIPDLNSGLRVMERQQVERFLAILPDGFSFTTTITLAMLTHSLPVGYVSVPYYPRSGRSKIRPVADTLRFLQVILRTAMYFRPLKVFGPLSGLFLVAALLVAACSGYLAGQVMDVTFGVLILSGVMVLLIGMLADLIVKKLD